VGLLCRIGDYPEFWMFDDTSMERRGASIRRKMMLKFPEYFATTRTSISKQNELGELIYYPDFVETGHILTYVLQKEGKYTMAVKWQRAAR
jgi:hypothetical protein